LKITTSVKTMDSQRCSCRTHLLQFNGASSHGGWRLTNIAGIISSKHKPFKLICCKQALTRFDRWSLGAIAMLRQLTAFTTALCERVGSMLNALDMRRIAASPRSLASRIQASRALLRPIPWLPLYLLSVLENARQWHLQANTRSPFSDILMRFCFETKAS
jgi:hypothetical protein